MAGGYRRYLERGLTEMGGRPFWTQWRGKSLENTPVSPSAPSIEP